MKRWIGMLLGVLALSFSAATFAAADIEINTPGVTALKQSLRARFQDLRPYMDSGAVGLTADGLLTVRDASSVPLAARQALNGLIAAQNGDRNALYKEIARANGHPEWEGEIRSIFAQRWIQRARPGWWVQSGGGWVQK
ncbi:MAG: DUF1318 domain-containing protein [Sideroxydans sp.]|nr:DUF1318 domain-containing protein [Sideroxydans sp.]